MITKMTYLLLALATICFALTGCINIKQAEINEATFNTAGWKSQAGVSGDATIEATTTPTTDISPMGL